MDLQLGVRNRTTARGLWQYKELLPVPSDLPLVTMGEGGTPLVKSCRIGPELGIEKLYFKLESCNPTGSFKDRIASMMVSRYAADGVQVIICATSGNAGSAIAAYAARADMNSVVLYLSEAPRNKQLQIHAYGSALIHLVGINENPANLAAAFENLTSFAREQGWGVALMSNRYDPINVEAYKTIAFEICEQLDSEAPGYMYIPVGGGGLFGASYKGFWECRDRNWASSMPRMVAVQPEGAASVFAGLERGLDQALPVITKSKISGVVASYTSDGDLVIQGIRDTNGHCSCPNDEETYAAQVRLAKCEGIFAEPAGAITIAALVKDVEARRIDPSKKIVCLISSSGFKDREIADQLFMPSSIANVRFDQLGDLRTLIQENGQLNRNWPR